jgi:hypothetical protein
MKVSVLSGSIEILKIAEATLAKERDFARKHRRFLGMLTAIEAIGNGMGAFVMPAAKFFAYFGVGLIILAAIAQSVSISPTNMTTCRFLAAIFSFAFVAFALPSSYVADGIDEVHVQEVASKLRAYAPMSELEVGAFEKTIGEFHERALARANAFQWVMAASWALATYLFSQYTGIALKLLPTHDVVQPLVDVGMQLVIFAFVSLLMLWAVFGYKRSVDKTFKLSRLALRQIGLELVSGKSSSHAVHDEDTLLRREHKNNESRYIAQNKK